MRKLKQGLAGAIAFIFYLFNTLFWLAPHFSAIAI